MAVSGGDRQVKTFVAVEPPGLRWRWRQSVSCMAFFRICLMFLIILIIACPIYIINFNTVKLSKIIPHTGIEKTCPFTCVFFLHMHKAGGTTVTYLFRDFKWYPRNGNGNPWEGRTGVVKFTDYGRKQFADFLLRLNHMKVQFIASEWNYFKHVEEIDISCISLVTCIRDPYARFVSNMFVNGANASELLNPLTWMNRDIQLKRGNLWVNFNKPNYYVKMMNGYGDEPQREVSREDLETAKRNLNDFDVVIILEVAESFRLLKKYGIEYDGEIKNVKNNIKSIGMTQEQFISLNDLDYEFYEYAKTISLSMLNAQYREKRTKSPPLIKARKVV